MSLYAGALIVLMLTGPDLVSGFERRSGIAADRIPFGDRIIYLAVIFVLYVALVFIAGLDASGASRPLLRGCSRVQSCKSHGAHLRRGWACLPRRQPFRPVPLGELAAAIRRHDQRMKGIGRRGQVQQRLQHAAPPWPRTYPAA